MDQPADETAVPARKSGWRWLRRAGLALLLIIGLIGAGALLLDTDAGHRLIADRVAQIAPKSGLKVQIGRIDGSIYGKAVLRDVTLSDPEGAFLSVPEAELDWRPLAWLNNQLDIRDLTARRGTLLKLPKLRPGDPDDPILPAFDIRIDRLRLIDFTVVKGIAGDARRVNLSGKADVRAGRLLAKLDGNLGGGDRLALTIDAAPDDDRFDIDADINAPSAGLLAALWGDQAGGRIRIAGDGAWRDWRGAALVDRDGARVAALQLNNRAGRYGVTGLVDPSPWLSGIAAKAAGNRVALRLDGSFVERVFEGRIDANLAAAKLRTSGAISLADNRFGGFAINGLLTDPALLGEGTQLQGLRLAALLDGDFRDLTIDYRLGAQAARLAGVDLINPASAGEATWNGTRLTLPVALRAQRIVTSNALANERLVGATLDGIITLENGRIASDQLALNAPTIDANLALRGDLARGAYALAGPAAFTGFPVDNVGLISGNGRVLFVLRQGQPWQISGNADARLARIDNQTIRTIAGENIRFSGNFSLGRDAPLLITAGRLMGSRVIMTLQGRRLADGTATITGQGRHVEYGAFSLDAGIGRDGPRAVLVLADPYPAAGLKDVRLALAPIADGFRIETQGQSALGPFTGTLGLFASPGGPTRIRIDQLVVSQTRITGNLVTEAGGVSGVLALAGGGLDGTMRITRRGNGHNVQGLINARNAAFDGIPPIRIAQGTMNISGFIAPGRSTINATISGQGIQRGNLFIGRLAANTRLVNGRGSVTASLTGRRGGRFALQGNAQVSAERIALLAQGEYDGKPITMPRRAVLTKEGSGWQLAQSQISYDGGAVIASGQFGGGATELALQLNRMPLALIDAFQSGLGLGGRVSGIVNYRQSGSSVPTGDARVQIAGLTRSGLVLSSRPIDMQLAATLGADDLEARGIIREGGDERGRLQLRISQLGGSNDLMQRLRSGSLFGQLRYAGPVDSLWRLTGVEILDFSGAVNVAADMRGSIDNPVLSGSFASDAARMQSGLIGADVNGIRVRGRFAESRLTLSSFSGRAGDGTVSGSGFVDLSGLATRGVGMDIRLAARNAQLVRRDDLAATVTGPMRIISDGSNGTIAGRLSVDRGRWQLGAAATTIQLPNVRFREVNRRADEAPRRAASNPWRYLIDARARNRLDVRGLGLDSEWSADIRLRGTVNAPQIYGGADLVRGGYEFAGKRFELDRGRIRFDGESPPDPVLDIDASADVQGIAARINVGGTGQRPEIRFSSTPSMPEEEVLSRLLFGSSITDISAPEALQLGAAVASLRGGGGLDPINQLRSAIGLDRLRIVGADVAAGRGTSVAAGKYLTRRTYVEVVTDGQGYSATNIEFQITRWLSVLSSISTVGRQSANVKVSKDY